MSDVITLDNSSLPVKYLCQKDKRLAKVISMVGPIEYTVHDDNAYAFLIHEIIEQMLSISAGAKIFGRLEDICNGEICPEKISELSNETLKSIGTSKNKAACIKSLTDSIMNHHLSLDDLTRLSDSDVIHELTKIKGIGNWTAKMYLIFVLNRPDILPTEDAAFLQAYKWLYKTETTDSDAITKKCKKWKPYASIASRYMYRALDMGLTKEPFHLFKT